MAGKKGVARKIILLAVLGATVMGVSYYGVNRFDFGDLENKQANVTPSTAETDENSAESASRDSGTPNQDVKSLTDQSSKDRKDKDSKVQQQQQESQEENATDEEEPDYLSIAGAVLDDAGHPVEGANVIAEFVVNVSRGEESAPQVSANQLTATTDRLGMFEFSNLEEGEYDLTASKGDDYFPAQMKVRSGMANAELVLQNLRPVRVYGIISDKQGAPLSAVRIRTLGTQDSVHSDANGSYEIVTAPMRAGTAPVLNFRLEGYQETRRRVQSVPSSDPSGVQIDVQMDVDSNGPKVAVTGQVLGPIGEAVAGVRVGLKSFKSDKGYSGRTNSSGEFEIPKAEIGEGYSLSVMPSEDYEAYQSEVFSLGPQDQYFEIELDAAKVASLSGTVTDLYGKPLSGFQLWLRGVGSSAQPQLPVRTDVAGRFHLEELRAGEVVIETRSRPLLRVSNIVLEPGKHKDIDIPLDWGSEWLLGRVIDAEGNPVSGASVIVSWKEQLHDLVSDSRRDLRSDLQGNFTASNLGADYYTLTVQAPGYKTFRGDHQLGNGVEELVIQIN